MAPTTALSDMYFYICDFLTDGTGNNQELNGEVAGDDYLTGVCTNYRSAGPLDFEKELFYGGKGYGIAYDSIERILTVNMKVTAAQHEDIWQYYYKHKDNKTDKHYAFWRKAASNYYPFFNATGGARDYCEGFLTNVVDSFSDGEPFFFDVLLIFEEVLSG